VRAADRTDASRLLAAARELGRDYIQLAKSCWSRTRTAKATSPTTSKTRSATRSSSRSNSSIGHYWEHHDEAIWTTVDLPYTLNVPLTQQLPLFRRLVSERLEQPRLWRRGAIRIADAEFLELGGVKRKGAVVERDRETDAAPLRTGA
jgi:hypothetical protein